MPHGASNTLNGLALALAILLAGCASALAGDVVCPAKAGKAELRAVTLFDGPADENASLAPDSSRTVKGVTWSEWDVTAIAKAGRRLFVRCDYGATQPPTVVEADSAVARCRSSISKNGVVSLTCTER